MFFRRVFARKEPTANGIYPPDNNGALPPIESAMPNNNSHHRGGGRESVHNQRMSSFSSSSDDNNKRVLSVLQLTPLWEHIIRTKALPSNINEVEMFEEFSERLRDPEWQVRQHALRVLVDVLIVMKDDSDSYFTPLFQPLVENLGHAAPAIRKGALDVLKVYMSETVRPDLAISDIIELGIVQPTGDSQLGRLSVGVMLSLPSLIQTTLDTSHRDHCCKMAIQALCSKMVQVMYQEVALKVLLRIREQIGSREFSEHINPTALREFELLCNVYGLPRSEIQVDASPDLYISTSAGGMRTWQVLNSDGDMRKEQPPHEKMWKSNSSVDETEYDTADPTDIPKRLGVKISLVNDTNSNSISSNGNYEQSISQYSQKSPAPILQPSRQRLKPLSDRDANSLSCHSGEERVILETEINIENTAVTMRILEQSAESHEIGYDEEEDDDDEDAKEPDDEDVFEHSGIVRVMTDSELDEINQTSNTLDVSDTDYNSLRSPRRVTFGGESVKMRTPDSESVSHSDIDLIDQPLQINIPNDNTQPLERGKSAAGRSSLRTESAGSKSISMSPVRRVRRLSMSPVNDTTVLSLTPSHRSIEVLHNLQRSPLISPTRIQRRNSTTDDAPAGQTGESTTHGEDDKSANPGVYVNKPNWEDLGLVDEKCLRCLESGDWRLRSQAINTIEESLKNPDHMTLVQPCLESFLRMLLSSEKHPEVIEDKRRILTNLITRLPLDTLERSTSQIIIGLCRHGGAGSNRVAKTLMQRLLPTVVVHRLLSDEFLQARSTRFRENALQMVLYALMTFPSTYFDIRTCVERATRTATDRKRRVRQAALDVLAVLGQISSTKSVMDIVQNMASTDLQIMQSSENGQHLGAAVKARLSRKQLPIVSADGNVQYALRIPSSDGRQTLAHPTSMSNQHLSSPSSYLIGADVDWIVAGIGSVSPTSLKRRSQRMQLAMAHQQNSTESETNRCSLMPSPKSSGATAMTTSKAPHEILAVGVGVRSAYGDPHYPDYPIVPGGDKSMSVASNPIGFANGGAGNGSGPSAVAIGRNETQDNLQSESNLNTAVSSGSNQFPTSNEANLHRPNARFYSRSIPELSDDSGGSSTSRLPVRVHAHVGTKPSRLPVTSRFPAMDSHPDGRFEGKTPPRYPHQPSTVGPQDSGLKQRFTNGPQNQPTSGYQYKTIGITATSGFSNHPQDSLTHQSSMEDERPISSAARFTMDATYQEQSQRRFTNVYKFFSGERTPSERQKPPSDISETTQTPQHQSVRNPNYAQEHPSSATQTPTIYRDHDIISHHSLYDDVDHPKTHQMATFLNEQKAAEAISDSGTTTGTTSEYSTEEISASATSTPTRRLVIDEKAGGDQHQEIQREQISIPSSPVIPKSRPLSIASQRSIQRRLSQHEDRSDTSRPNLAHRSNTSGSINRSIRSTNSSINDVHSLSASVAGSRRSSLSERIPPVVSLVDKQTREIGPTDIPLQSPSNPYEGDAENRPLSNMSHVKNRDIDSVSPTIQTSNVQSEIYQSPSHSTNIDDETQPEKLDEDSNAFDHPNDNEFQENHEYPGETEEIQPPISVYIPKSNRPPRLVRKVKGAPSKASHTTMPPQPPQSVQNKNKSTAQPQNLFPSTLPQFDKPRDTLHQCLQHLDSASWEETMTGIQYFVRLLRHHPDAVEPHLHVFCMALSKHIKNLRSQVSRASCQAAGELFERKAKLLETETEDVSLSLLNRTADTNKFLRSDAMQALESMCDHMPATKIFQVLTTRGATHQNAIVRSASAKLCARTVHRVGCDRVFGMSKDLRDRLIVTSANLLMEGSLETRNHAKAIFKMLSGHQAYPRTLLEVIPPKTYRNIEKTLKSIR